MSDWQVYGNPIAEEFAADLGDPRRTQRLIRCGSRIAEKPDASFLEIFEDPAELEGFYRLVRSDYVDMDTLLSGHRDQTRQRCNEHDEVLVLHDTTEFRFPLVDGYMREGLHSFSKEKQGFRGHFSMAASADGLRLPLGIVGVRGFVPPSADADVKAFWDNSFGELVNLNDRWWDGVQASEECLDGHSLIHVADREADFFSLLALMEQHDYRYVVRAKHNRGARADDAAVVETLDEVLSTGEFVAQREVELSARPIGARPPASRRKHPPRTRRTACLDFRSVRVTLEPPPRPGRSTAVNQPDEYIPIEVTAIEVVEQDPPEDATAVRWILLTSERIEGVPHLMRVVDMYRTRWLIEEMFKSLKTGCSYQKRQMSSAGTLLATLALLLPNAWRLLMMRHLERHCPDEPASTVLTDAELKVLKLRPSKHPLPRNPTVADACIAIARIGGYKRQNGPPGWQTIGRGYEKLVNLVEGYELMRAELDL